MAEDELVEALASNLDANFARVIDTYQHRLYAFALRMAGDPRDAEEITQDAFIRAYRALASYPADRLRVLNLRPWLYQIVLNTARNRHRIRRWPVMSLSSPTDDSSFEPRASLDTDPENLALASERHSELARCLLDLPLRFRAAVVLRHVIGLPYTEVAAALGIPIGTAKANVHRGTRLLRLALTDADLAPHHPIRSDRSTAPKEATA